MINDQRWQQRFQNFQKAYLSLDELLIRYREKPNDKAFILGTIKAYELLFELGWKTLQDYLKSKGIEAKYPRDIIREAFQKELIVDAELWLQALDDRNETAHVYNEAVVKAVIQNIEKLYFPMLESFHDSFTPRVHE